MSDPVSILAEEVEAELEAAFLAAIETISANVDVPSLIEAAERGDDDTVLGYVGDHLRPVHVILDRAFARAGTLAAERLGLTFDPAEPTATAARASTVAALMRSLVADTVKAMLAAANRVVLLPAATVLASGLLLAPTPLSAAEKAILVREAIGLTPPQAVNLTVFRAALQATQAAQDQPATRVGFRPARPDPELPPYALRHLSAPQRSVIEKSATLPLDRATVDALVAQQRRTLLKVRAAAVATSGAITATNAGEHASWQQAVDRRDLGPNWRRFWIDAGDEKVRHAHRQVATMNPEGVGLHEPFATPLGECLHPPLEVNCRCRVELREAA